MKKITNSKLKLTPKLHPLVKQVISNKQLMRELVDGLGSPLNLVFPQLIVENKDKFVDVFNKHQVLGKVYYAHKSNQSSALVRQLALETDSYIDVASIGELRHALSCGFAGSRIGATGPKTEAFLLLCIQHEVLISVDSQQELDTIAQLSQTLGKKAKITIRLCGFESEDTKILSKDSRFGIPIQSISGALQVVVKSKWINLMGFAFHLGSTAVKDWAVAIQGLIKALDKAQDLGLNSNLISIGGGYKVNYLENQQDWDSYVSALKEMVLGERDSFTWNNHGFGLRSENGTLKGKLSVYNFYNSSSADKFLDEILSYKIQSISHSIGEVLRDRMVEVMIEPGRALVDQCGITLGKVIYEKKSSRGENLVGIDMNREDVTFMGQELLLDPMLISQDDNQVSASAFVVGNLCLEGDLVFIRKINFDHTPKPGDILVFANTAGYFSDFSAHSAIRQPRAQKVAVTKLDESMSWSLDQIFSPILKGNINEV